MSLKKNLLPEENKRLIEISKAHPELTMLDIIDKYASDEFKALVDAPDDVEVY